MAEAVEEAWWPPDDEAELWPAAESVEASAELTDTAPLQRELPEFTPLMQSLHLDSPLLLSDDVTLAQAESVAGGVVASGEDELYNHHALLELQDSLQQQSSRPATTAPSTANAAVAPRVFPGSEAPLTVTPAFVACAVNAPSAVHQKRLDAYYLRLQAYHLQRALADEEKQQLDDRRDRILERHTLSRLKQAMRQQRQQPTHYGPRDISQHDAPSPTQLAHDNALEAAVARQAQVAELRETRLAHKHRLQQMYAQAAAARKESEELAEQRLRKSRLAADEAVYDQQARVQHERAERQRRAQRMAAEREASANFATIANSVAQQVGQLERREWREHRQADTQQVVQHRRQRAEQHKEQVQAVLTENYQRRQINAVLQQQAAEAVLAQRQIASLQRQQQHRLALLAAKVKSAVDSKQPAPFQLPPPAVQPPPPPLPAHTPSVASATPDTVASSHASSPLAQPLASSSLQSSADASPLLAARAAGGGGAPATSPLAPLLFLLESRAKRMAEQRLEESKQ